MLFKVFFKDGKILGSKTDNKIFLKSNLSTSLLALDSIGMGDPHMMLRIYGGGILARWDDNAPASENTELLFLHLETDTDTVSIFYRNGVWGNNTNIYPKVISSVKYIHNGTTVSGFTGTTKIGPVTLTSNTNDLYTIRVQTDYISNVKKFGGGMALALAASASANKYVDGGWGPTNDGYNILGSGLGATYNRNNLVVGSGVTIGPSGSVTSPLIFDSSSVVLQRILGFSNAHFTGTLAAEVGLPLDPIALQLADMQAPGGDFDGLINQPSVTGGIIDASGNRGSGLAIYGSGGMPAEIAYIGSHNGSGYNSGGGGSGEPYSYTDPYFNNVSLLLHMNGASGSTNFIDSSSYGLSGTKYGNTIISTNNAKFGTSSAYFDGPNAGSIVRYDNFPALGSSDFTIESWVFFKQYDTGEGTTHIIGQHWSANSNEWLFGISSLDKFEFTPGSGSSVATTGTITYNTWNHLAAVRHNNNITLFVNGQSGYTGPFSYSIPNTLPLTIGGDYSQTNCMVGYLDEIRITSGVARYTSNFSVPIAPFPDSYGVGQLTSISWE